MRYDLTDKLKFEEDPVIVIGDTELTVKSDALTVLGLLDAVAEKGDAEGARMAADMLLSEADREKLAALALKVDDYVTVVKAMIALATGRDPESVGAGE